MVTNDENKPIDPEEYKKVTEAMYKQNLELARLYKEVDALNKQRESLMHLITHKVKGSFTHSKYIFAGMLDGTFGETNEEMKKIAEEGLEANDGGIKTIDLVLNAANLQKGTVKYDMKIFDFRDMVENLLKEKHAEVKKKNLAMEGNLKEGVYNVLGDIFWIKEAVSNLIENSIKYTKEGKIIVDLRRAKPARNASGIADAGGENKIILSIKDTGIGITDEDKKNLFTEGGRGKESVKVNVDSTGYGLYSVKLVVEAHKGRVSAESEGAGKGSTFFIELPLA
ncbi:hypothetical protein A3A05_00440 [Candidatus Nomurabacteria bacterium RIFCSPLOWO2_01_FULL_41_12]|uniref:histidine kinase n=1 Tax=Candidatus Nomurabacteria bacterium RIFCSPLOWO2_01_FULL_41_12 TaxID=1801774 RepID=A0A1F6WWF8_9BACT|nr:MAG: hypothetical protein A2732_01670 [Candidatus Nomurabacteria bacterium RIFCSPHIGHO2_01_FULL_40_10]OGI86221.1 MAG: hypothetical protein A3A05_00440 [Candidatus Nomurabacteria bacterium RIFCSPLOWO2_01_FULL_41_12]